MTIKKTYSFGALLLSLLIMFVVNPWIPDHNIAVFSFHLFFSVMILMTIYSLSHNRNVFMVGFALALISLGTTWYSAIVLERSVEMTSHLVTAVFLLFVIVILGKQVLSAERINREMIFGAIILYLFVGILWGMVYAAMLDINPEAFSGDSLFIADGVHPAVRSATRIENMIYYSFVTLTTLGYGDIIPIALSAKFYSFLEAITGQMFIATVVGRLIQLLRV